MMFFEGNKDYVERWEVFIRSETQRDKNIHFYGSIIASANKPLVGWIHRNRTNPTQMTRQNSFQFPWRMPSKSIKN